MPLTTAKQAASLLLYEAMAEGVMHLIMSNAEEILEDHDYSLTEKRRKAVQAQVIKELKPLFEKHMDEVCKFADPCVFEIKEVD